MTRHVSLPCLLRIQRCACPWSCNFNFDMKHKICQWRYSRCWLMDKHPYFLPIKVYKQEFCCCHKTVFDSIEVCPLFALLMFGEHFCGSLAALPRTMAGCIGSLLSDRERCNLDAYWSGKPNRHRERERGRPHRCWMAPSMVSHNLSYLSFSIVILCERAF